MTLSILICTLPERNDSLINLKAQLYGQIILSKLKNEVEVIVLMDSGKMSIGEKRNKLLGMATGKYVCFIDDDDLVHENYVKLIVDAVKEAPDVVNIHLKHFLDGKFFGDTIHSLAYSKWINRENKDGTWNFYRNPNHLNPVKHELALKAGFPAISDGEDKAYSMKLLKYLKTSATIDEPVYFYMDK